jgi:hypothetical protein
VKRTEYEVIQQLKDHLLTLPSGLTKREVAEKAFAAFPNAEALLVPGWKDKWCWEQLRGARDEEQLPMFAYNGGKTQKRGEWGEEEYRKQAQRYDRAARANAALRDKVIAEYNAKTNQQLVLWPDETVEV